MEMLQNEAEDTDSRIRTATKQLEIIVDDLRSFGMEPVIEDLEAEMD